MLAKNAESSRAVPIKKRIDMIRNNPFVPIVWGSNQAGMVAGKEIDNKVYFSDYAVDEFGYAFDETLFRDDAWKYSAEVVADLMEAWDDAGYHKQIVNRIGEAFTTVKGVITGTEWDNFFHLRRDKHADPAIKELADCMWKAKCEVEEKDLVEILQAGEWHTPYVEHWRDDAQEIMYGVSSGIKINWLSLEQALKTSAVACGQVSFRNLDTSEETVERVWERLMGGEAVHASVTEHQGTPMQRFEWPEYTSPDVWLDVEEKGITHADRDKQYWSAKFKHWIMFRKTIPNEYCSKYVPNE